jgi:16S rRNA (cytosine967-C5)-methyltransferase
MKELKDARGAALAILNSYRPQGSNLSQLIGNELQKADGLSDRGFARDLVWSTVKYLNTLDWLIDAFAAKPKKLEPAVRNILRLGLVQLLYFSDRVPEYAAVNEAVAMARKHRQQAAPMVNALLRRTLREKDRLPWPDCSVDDVECTAIRLAHPAWLVRRWQERRGDADAEKLCAADNAAPPLTVRVNTLKISRDGLRERLAADGVSSELCPYSPDGLALTERPEIERLESFSSGLFIVQDEASQLVSRVLAARCHDTVLDLCSGAGIKASHIAQLTGGRARIVAVDNAAPQLQRAAENFKRLGITNIETRQEDLTRMPAFSADRVLIDVPCSGIGVIRRKPDIKWNRTATDITERYPALQRELLTSAAERVKPGGTLVYSTCSIEPDEDETLVAAFLAQHPSFSVERLEPPAVPETFITADGFFRSFPHRHNTDGFFAARLIRIK